VTGDARLGTFRLYFDDISIGFWKSSDSIVIIKKGTYQTINKNKTKTSKETAPK
jgi:hypothetical protein